MIRLCLTGVIFAWLLLLSFTIMRVSAPVTDYIRASIINTKGDLVVRGDLVPELLRTGTVNTFFRGKGAAELPAYENLGEGLDTYLKAQGVGVDPIFEKLALRDTGVFIGSASRATAGDQTIAGVGYDPSAVIFFAYDSGGSRIEHSIGVDNGTVHYAHFNQDGVQIMLISANFSIQVRTAAGSYYTGYISSTNSDGFVIAWTKVGTPNVINIAFICLP